MLTLRYDLSKQAEITLPFCDALITEIAAPADTVYDRVCGLFA